MVRDLELSFKLSPICGDMVALGVVFERRKVSFLFCCWCLRVKI